MTTEEMLDQAIKRRQQRQRMFTRRDAYLLIWGIVFTSVGWIFALGNNNIMGFAFIVTGVVSIVAAAERHSHMLDVSAFTLLAGVSAAEGVRNAIDPSLGPTLAVLATTLWLGVSCAQVVVAGWPVPDGTRCR